jgi:hypothetical protein
MCFFEFFLIELPRNFRGRQGGGGDLGIPEKDNQGKTSMSVGSRMIPSGLGTSSRWVIVFSRYE